MTDQSEDVVPLILDRGPARSALFLADMPDVSFDQDLLMDELAYLLGNVFKAKLEGKNWDTAQAAFYAFVTKHGQGAVVEPAQSQGPPPPIEDASEFYGFDPEYIVTLVKDSDRKIAALLMSDLLGFDANLDRRLREGKFDHASAIQAIVVARLMAAAA